MREKPEVCNCEHWSIVKSEKEDRRIVAVAVNSLPLKEEIEELHLQSMDLVPIKIDRTLYDVASEQLTLMRPVDFSYVQCLNVLFSVKFLF